MANKASIPSVGQSVRIWRLVVKAAVIFALFNVIFYLVEPVKWLNTLTIYNSLVPGRTRIPFSEAPELSNNISIFDLNQIFASHVIAHHKAADEYRVVLLGDSSVWGYLLQPDQTQAACLNQLNLTLPSGHKVRFYNLGYPKLTVIKDVLLLQKALEYEPDLIVWSTTLASLYPKDQLGDPNDASADFPIISKNRERLATLMAQFSFRIPDWSSYPKPTWQDRTFFGQRVPIELWLRYQLYGFGWAATGKDYALAKFVLPHPVNLSPDDSVFAPHTLETKTPHKIVAEDLTLDVLKGGIQLAADRHIPVLLVNEPIAHPGGETRLSFYYPRWAYEDYRIAIKTIAAQENWHYVDFWDAEPTDVFTDTDFHMTPQGNCDFATKLKTPILDLANKS